MRDAPTVCPVASGVENHSGGRTSNSFCPICGDHPTLKELIDYDPFCGIPGEIGRDISRGKPTCARRTDSVAGQFNPDEVTGQDMKKALNDPSLGIKVIDVREPDEYEIAKVEGVPLLP